MVSVGVLHLEAYAHTLRQKGSTFQPVWTAQRIPESFQKARVVVTNYPGWLWDIMNEPGRQGGKICHRQCRADRETGVPCTEVKLVAKCAVRMSEQPDMGTLYME